MKKILLLNLCILSCAFAALAQPTMTDIAYGSDSKQKLDYYKATNPNSPVIIVLHGGGWSTGDKNGNQVISNLFQGAGNAVVCINYRLDTEVPYSGYPSQSSDLAYAIAWTKTNAQLFNGDSSKVVLYGYSAGGHLVALHGLYPNNNFFADCGNKVSLNVAAVMVTNGVFDFNATPKTTIWPYIFSMLCPTGSIYSVNQSSGSNYKADSAKYWADAQPINHVSATVGTKFLCITGKSDTFLGQQQYHNFYDSMMTHKQCIEVHFVPGDHGTIFGNNTATDTVFVLMKSFLNELWSNTLCSVTSAEEIPASNNSISIYPNPAKGDFTIVTTTTEKQWLEIFDITGKIMITQPILNGKGIVDSNNLPEGVYNICVTNNEQKVNRRLVIVR